MRYIDGGLKLKVVFGKPWESPQKVLLGQALAGVATIRHAAKVSIIIMAVASVSGCVTSQPSTASNRLKQQAAMCASALADGVIESARRECLAHLAQMEAGGNW